VTVLVVYASKHGGTAEIAETIGAVLRGAGLDAYVAPAASAPDPAGYGAVVLGSPIYAGSWLQEALDYAAAYGETIAGLPTWLFSSGPLGDPEPSAPEQPAELAHLTATLQPRWHTLFGGLLDPDRLEFGERMIMEAVKAEAGDYRNWDRIRAWAVEIGVELTSA
jgi:menaquinone-dependent protoporphyrinogen oxidase